MGKQVQVIAKERINRGDKVFEAGDVFAADADGIKQALDLGSVELAESTASKPKD